MKDKEWSEAELQIQKAIGSTILCRMMTLDPNLAMSILEQTMINFMFVSLGHVPLLHMELYQQIFDNHGEYIMTQIKLMEEVLPKS